MPELPKGFHSQGFDWTIKADAAVLRSDENYGETHWRKFEVTISDDFPIEEQRRTLLHELLHVSSQWDKPEERTLSFMAINLFALLTDNPQLRAFIWPEGS